jgi:tetratricopeptide (TPR) repeat protein
MSCLTCHDPHRKVPESRRKVHYRDACLGCHTVEACTVEAMGAPAGMEGVDRQDCVACHMPRRRTQDVIHVAMTDHRIQRRAAPEGERLAPREEQTPVITQVEFLSTEAPAGALGEIYRTSTVLRAHAGDPAVELLYPLLLETEPDALPPYLDGIRALLRQRHFGAAEELLHRALELQPDHPQLLEWHGAVLASQGRIEEAIAVLERAVILPDHRPEVAYNLGGLLLHQGQTEAAAERLREALEDRPNLASAHFFLGSAEARLGRTDAALAAYQRTLEIDPAFTRGYLALAQSLLARGEAGDREAALRWLRHGARVARPAEPLLEALRGLE